MIHPSKAGKVAKDWRRAVVNVSSLDPKAKISVASPDKCFELPGRYAFLDWLTRDGDACPEVWLTDGSIGWDVFVPDLLRAGYMITPHKRGDRYTGLKVIKPGHPVAREKTKKGRSWQGRSASGMVHTERGLTDMDRTRATWEKLTELSEAVREHWPGVSLGPSLSYIGIDIFKQYLQRPLGLSRDVALELRSLDSYGGGRIELYCKRGSVFEAFDAISDDGEAKPMKGLGPWEVDIRGAYVTAMQSGTVSGEFADIGPESAWSDPCTITTAIVSVPDTILYPPLRYRTLRHIHYPTGPMLGTWTSDELKAATDVGCKIHQVHKVFRFVNRGAEFAEFADSLVRFRAGAQKGSAVDVFAKGVAVQAVGALASKPKLSMTTCSPRTYDGATIDRPGIYTVPVFKPSEREVISAASDITGKVRSWMGRLLCICQKEGVPAIYCHTDGLACLTDPTWSVEELARQGGPNLETWKIQAIRKLEIFAPNRRITEHYPEKDGVARVTIASGGISRDHTARQMREMMRGCKGQWAIDSAQRAEGKNGWTVPRSTLEFDTQRAERIATLFADDEKTSA